MHVSDIAAGAVDGGIEWSARVTFADQEHVLRYGGPADLVEQADASMFLAATLLPAMAWQQDLEIDGAVSPQLLARVPQIARTYHLMDPRLRVPGVRAASSSAPAPAPAPAPAAAGGLVGCFFSRGIDSTYSAAVDRTTPGAIEALVYCATLEPVHDPANRDLELEAAQRVAERLGLPLHPIWTNLRTFTDPMLGWSTMHGAGLASMALLVGQAFSHVVVPSAYDVTALPPCGSHPLLDPLFSSESVTVFHDHLDRTRQGKAEWLVANRPDLLAELKVCYSDNRVDNCGRCHKCLLTMANLRAAGGLHLAPGFPDLDLDLIRGQRVGSVGVRKLWVPVLHAAAARGDAELRDAVGDLLRQSAVPPLRQLLAGRSTILDRVLGRPTPFDPEVTTAFERFDKVHADHDLALLRHGEVLLPGPEGQGSGPSPLRASTVAGSLAASLRHRAARRRAR